MAWYVDYRGRDGHNFVRSSFSLHRDIALQHAFALHQSGNEVLRIVGPDGQVIERGEFDNLYEAELARQRERPERRPKADAEGP